METPADQTVETEQERQYQDRGEEEEEDTRLFLPTGTEQVRIFYFLLSGCLL